MEPVSVEGVLQVDGELTYVVKQNTRRRGSTSDLDRSNAVFVKAANFRQVYPELVIDFYQSRVIWGAENPEEESNEQTYVASQIVKLCKLDVGTLDDETVIGGDLQEDNAIRSEVEYAGFPEDLEETDLSSGINSVASINDSELDSEAWKHFLEDEDVEADFPE